MALNSCQMYEVTIVSNLQVQIRACVVDDGGGTHFTPRAMQYVYTPNCRIQHDLNITTKFRTGLPSNFEPSSDDATMMLHTSTL